MCDTGPDQAMIDQQKKQAAATAKLKAEEELKNKQTQMQQIQNMRRGSSGNNGFAPGNNSTFG